MMKTITFLVLIPVVLLAACSRDTAAPVIAPKPAPSDGQGAALYREHCAQCHGPEGQGHPDWQTPNDGTFTAAPPLDAHGRAPGRTKTELVATIRRGVRKDGIDSMPAYDGRLSEQEIDAVVSWFQVFWPPEVRDVWLKANQ